MKARLTPTVGIILTTLCAVGLAGCIVSVGNGSKTTRGHAVPAAAFSDIVATHGHIELGMPRDQAIALFPASSVSLKEANAKPGFGQLHVYVVRARDARAGTYYERWMYFANDCLVAFSDQRLDTEDDARVHAWFNLTPQDK